MARNTKEQVHKAFEIAKKVYSKEISVSQGADILASSGLKRSSGFDYIYAYSKLIEGKLYTRTINAYATDYYLGKILEGNGKNVLKTALLALYQHIEYYEGTSGASVKKGRKVFEKFFELVKDEYAETIFPDEVEDRANYFEGKTKTVKVNSYERNQLARQECIEHFGLNCQVCDFNFQDNFGELGKSFIHVHHKVDISTIRKEYSVNPRADLVPVCPNCHAMLHKRKPAYTISELKDILRISTKEGTK